MDILLVDDHAATREEIRALLETEEDLDVVGEAGDGPEGIRQARTLHPDVVLMDIIMPGMNGIEATRAIRGAVSAVRILALSNHTGGNLVRAALSAGAGGYLRKDQAFEELIPAIRTVARGQKYIGAGVVD
ncbi:MAG: response regulator transcription factor [Lentisphaerae bacterium]|nr:response regulator transcription factor [Lentisphaerota bacterium]